jgi:hypothetical protein
MDPFAPALDHIDRVADGGGDGVDNLRLTHRWCNLARESGPRWEDEAGIAARIRMMYPARVERLLAN